MRYAPHALPIAEPTGWYNYEFRTRIPCALGCAPGAHVLYLGKTNRPWERVLEHAKTQPWFRYASGYEIHPDMYAEERDALNAEREKIRALLPIANIEHNEDNEHRLYFGPTAPLPAGYRRPPRTPRRESAPSSRRSPGRRGLSGRQRALIWLSVWLVLALVLTGWCWQGVHVPFWDASMVSFGGATAVAFFALSHTRPRHAYRRRR